MAFCHGGGRQLMCDPEGYSTVSGAVGGGGGPPRSEGGGGEPWLPQTPHLFRHTHKGNKTHSDWS